MTLCTEIFKLIQHHQCRMLFVLRRTTNRKRTSNLRRLLLLPVSNIWELCVFVTFTMPEGVSRSLSLSLESSWFGLEVKLKWRVLYFCFFFLWWCFLLWNVRVELVANFCRAWHDLNHKVLGQKFNREPKPISSRRTFREIIYRRK